MIEPKLQNQIEEQLSDLPIVQYAWIDPQDIAFAEEARIICRQECPRYGKSWSCPPGVGTVEKCRQECSTYEGVFVFTTVVEVQDIMNMEETLRTRMDHEAVTRAVQSVLRQYYEQTLPLSGESCELCDTCAYPDAPCRHPEHQISCVEGYGIVVPSVAEKAGLEFDNGYNIVTWFGMVLFRGRKQNLS
jgi:predicted metal-binding protein